MTTTTKFATSASGTSWTTPANANADDGAYATYTIAAKTTTGNVNTLSNFGFNSAIPSGATINSVTLEVQHKVSTTSSIAFLESAVAIGATVGTFNSDSSEPLADTIATYTNVTRPGGGAWTRADLLDGTFTVQLRLRTGNSATSVTGSWDYAKVTVDYTADVSVALTGQSSASGAGTLVPGNSLAISGEQATVSSGTLTALKYDARITATGDLRVTTNGDVRIPVADPNVTLALSGEAVTASAGTLSPAMSPALSGQGATTSAGTVTPALSEAITGQSVASGSGTLVPATSPALSGQGVSSSAGTLSGGQLLSGQAVTPSAGTVTAGNSKALSGQAATSSAGTLVPSPSIALSGQAVTASAGTLTPAVSKALSGDSATASAGTLVPANAPSLAGQTATASSGTLVPVTSPALTGQEVTASAGTLTVQVGSDVTIALSGESVTASAGSSSAETSVSLSGSIVSVVDGFLTIASDIVVEPTGGGNSAARRKARRAFEEAYARRHLPPEPEILHAEVPEEPEATPVIENPFVVVRRDERELRQLIDQSDHEVLTMMLIASEV